MNTNSKTQGADGEPRVVCTDWDEEVPVATWSKGRRRKPARKVITNGKVRIALTRPQTERIANMLGRGNEVRLTAGGEDAIRLFPCADTDFRTMFVASETMGDFRHAAYRGRRLAFTSRHGRRRIGREEIEERVERAGSGAAERRRVTPDTVVECPKCGFEFRVGKSLK